MELLHFRLWGHWGRGVERLYETEKQGIGCDIVYPRNARATPMKSHQCDSLIMN